MSDVPDLPAAEKAVARDVEAIFEFEAPRSEAGRAMAEEIRTAARTSPTFRAKLVAKWRASGGKIGSWARGGFGAAPARALARQLTLGTLGLASSGLGVPDLAAPVGEVARDALVHYEQAQRFGALRDIAGDAGLDEAISRVKAVDPVVPAAEVRDYVRQVQSRRPGVGPVAEALRPSSRPSTSPSTHTST